MKSELAFDLVSAIIANEFNVSVSTITPETVASDINGWDSFSHCNLIMIIESRLGFELPFEELLEAGSVGELSRIIEQVSP